MGISSRNDKFLRVKEDRDHLLEDIKAYRMNILNLEKTLLDREIAMKRMTQSVVYLKRTASRLKTDNRFLMKTNKNLPSHSWKTTMSRGRITEKLLTHIITA